MLQNKCRVRPKNGSLTESLKYVRPAINQRVIDEKHPFKLRYIGELLYQGYDDNGNRALKCSQMDVIEVSKKKAQQLLTDYLGDWAFLGSSTGEALF